MPAQYLKLRHNRSLSHYFQLTIIFLQLPYRYQIKNNDISVACCTYEGSCIQGFGVENLRKEANWKTQT